MTPKLYGISNCDTVRKARKWLEAKRIDCDFTDYRKQPLTPEQLQAWCEHLGWQSLLNRRSTSWRQLDEAERVDLDADKAIKLMLIHPTLIKRPLLEWDNGLLLGFKAAEYEAALL